MNSSAAAVNRVSTGYWPRPWQSSVHKILKRFSVLVVHRRGGKTVLMVNTLIDSALRCEKPNGRFGYLAPFQRQARAVAWDYFKQFTVNIPGIEYSEMMMQVKFPNGARIQLFGADNPDSLRGMYFDGIGLDEVADMRPQVWGEIIRPALADRLGWAIFIGTPKGINLFSELYFRAEQDEDWATILLTCYDTDSLDPDEIDAAKREMTEDQFNQEMLCDFHAAVFNTLISVQEVREAMARRVAETAYNFAPKIMAVDVAWMGGDRSCIVRRQGCVMMPTKVFPKIDPMDLVGQVTLEADRWEPDMIFVDVGYAPGVYDRVKQLGYPCMPVKFGGKPIDDRFENKRAEMWFNFIEWVKDGGCLPDEPALITDLCAPTYNMNNIRGKIQLESKDSMRKRGLRSPDIGDAGAMTVAFPVIGKQQRKARQWNPKPVSYDYDPLEVH